MILAKNQNSVVVRVSIRHITTEGDERSVTLARRVVDICDRPPSKERRPAAANS